MPGASRIFVLNAYCDFPAAVPITPLVENPYGLPGGIAMRTALTSLMAAALLLGSGLLAAPSAAAAAAGPLSGGAEAPIGVMTGLLAIGFLLAHRAMSDDD